MDRYPCFPLLLNSFTLTSPSYHQSLALPSDIQDVDGWMWLSAEPAVIAPKLARNSGQNFQKQRMPLPPAKQKRSTRFLGCQVSADRSNARTQCQSHSELPQEGFACVCWHLSQPARGHGLPGDALWKYVTHMLAGNNVSNAWPVAFLENRRKLWKAFHVLKNINDLWLLEMSVNSDDSAVVMCGSSQCCVYTYQEK